ncbi:hypothetical protein [Aquamicrobium terrae]|uniref:Uncharacterized protein n=1 Tax=Aquamicrobium terrae TaxID=1324945 RepID=A0ABV2N7J1_9HYPH
MIVLARHRDEPTTLAFAEAGLLRLMFLKDRAKLFFPQIETPGRVKIPILRVVV